MSAARPRPTGLFETWVGHRRRRTTELAARTTARTRYAALVAAGGDWLPGIVIRKPMSDWQFDDARDGDGRGGDASSPIATRLQAATTELGLAFPAALEPAYEIGGLDRRPHRARRADRGLDRRPPTAVRTARDALAAERDAARQRSGCTGRDPRPGYDAALAACAAGDDAGAVAGSAATVAALAGAEEIGRGRALTAGVGLVVVVLLRAARRLAACSGSVGAGTRGSSRPAADGRTGAPVGPDEPTSRRRRATDPYATLAATPDPVEGAEVGGRGARGAEPD